MRVLYYATATEDIFIGRMTINLIQMGKLLISFMTF